MLQKGIMMNTDVPDTETPGVITLVVQEDSVELRGAASVRQVYSAYMALREFLIISLKEAGIDLESLMVDDEEDD